MALFICVSQCRITFLIDEVDFSSLIEQMLSHSFVTISCSQHKRRVASLILNIDVYSFGKEHFDDIKISKICCINQSIFTQAPKSRLAFYIEISSFFQQKLGIFHMILLSSNNEHCVVGMLAYFINISTHVDQNLN